MRNVVERHLPYIHHSTVGERNKAFGIGLDYTHLPAREVGYQHSEADGNQQQRLIFLHYAQIQQAEGKQVHQKVGRVSDQVAERRHMVQSVEYFSHNS